MTLSRDLEREHAEIDQGIAAFGAGLEVGDPAVASLTAALDELRRHIYFEEEQLFPPLQQAGLVPPLFVMRREHGEIWATMDALSAELTSEADSAVVRKLVADLVSQLQDHNMKEEMIVYPAADRMIAAPVLDELSASLALVSRPAGWVCEAAR